MMQEIGIQNTNRLLNMYSGPKLFVFLTGASGAGKTHFAHTLENCLDLRKTEIAFFDKIGVPSTDEMVKEYGSQEKWQEEKTYEWIEKLAAIEDKPLLILEGQYNPEFVVEGCRRLGITNYVLCVVHCSDDVREKRLSEKRGQPELCNEDMRNWARMLHDKTVAFHGHVLDTSDSNTNKTLNELSALIDKKLRQPS